MVDDAFDDVREKGTHRTVIDGALRLTKEEAEQFSQESSDLLHRWNERTRGRDPGRRTYSVLLILQQAVKVVVVRGAAGGHGSLADSQSSNSATTTSRLVSLNDSCRPPW